MEDGITVSGVDKLKVIDTLIFDEDSNFFWQIKLLSRFLYAPNPNDEGMAKLANFIEEINIVSTRQFHLGEIKEPRESISAIDISYFSQYMLCRYTNWQKWSGDFSWEKRYAEEQMGYWKKMEETALLLVN